jgi:hypothetical protein
LAAVPPEPDPLHVRLSDTERDEAAAYLREQMSEGRLTLYELEERLGKVYDARYRVDLAGLFDDLPSPVPAVPSPPPAVVQSGPPIRARHTPRRVDAIRSYVFVNTLCIAIWMMTGFGYFWPIWVLVPWGIVLLSKLAKGPGHGPAQH